MRPTKDRQGHEVEFLDYWDEDADKIYWQYHCPVEDKNVIVSESKTDSKYEEVSTGMEVYNITPTEMEMITNDAWQNNSTRAFDVLNRLNMTQEGKPFIYPSDEDVAYLTDLFGYQATPTVSETGYLDPSDPKWQQSVEHIKERQAGEGPVGTFGPQSGMQRGEPTRHEWGVTSYLNELGLDYVHKMTLGELDPAETTHPDVEYDIYIPLIHTAIESSPSWHAGGKKSGPFPDVVEHDEYKTDFAKSHGIDLLVYDPEKGGSEKFINDELAPLLRTHGVKAFDVPVSKEEEGRWDDKEKELDKEYERWHGRLPSESSSPPPPPRKRKPALVSTPTDEPYDSDTVEVFGPIIIKYLPKTGIYDVECIVDEEGTIGTDYDSVADWLIDHLEHKHSDEEYSPTMNPPTDKTGMPVGYTIEDIKGLREEGDETKHWLPDYQHTPKALMEDVCPNCGKKLKTYKDSYDKTRCSWCNYDFGYKKEEERWRDDSQNIPRFPERGKVNTAIQEGPVAGNKSHGMTDDFEATGHLFTEEEEGDWYSNYGKPKYTTCPDCGGQMELCPDCYIHHHVDNYMNEHNRYQKILYANRPLSEIEEAFRGKYGTLFPCPKDIAPEDIPAETKGEEGKSSIYPSGRDDFEKGNPFNQTMIYREKAGQDWDYVPKYREKPILQEEGRECIYCGASEEHGYTIDDQGRCEYCAKAGFTPDLLEKPEEETDKLTVSKLDDIGDFYTHKPLNNIDSTTGEESPMQTNYGYQEEGQIPFSLKIERQLEKAGYPSTNEANVFGRELGTTYVVDMWLGGENYATFSFQDVGSGNIYVVVDVAIGHGYYSDVAKSTVVEWFEDLGTEVGEVHPHNKGDHFHFTKTIPIIQIPDFLEDIAEVANKYPSPYELWMNVEKPGETEVKDWTPQIDTGVVDTTKEPKPKEPESTFDVIKPIEWSGDLEPWPQEEIDKVIEAEKEGPASLKDE
jgi:hypothetical protein